MVGIVAVSAAAGFASMFFEAPPIETKSKSRDRAPRHSGADPDEDDEDLRVVGRHEQEPNKSYKNGVLTGRVTNARNGEPVAGVRVEVMEFFSPDASPRRGNEATGIKVTPAAKIHAKTGDDGSYTLNIPPSVGPVYVRPTGSFKGGVKPERVGFDGTEAIDFEVEPFPRVLILPKDSLGEPVRKFVVRAKRSAFLNSQSRSWNFDIHDDKDAYMTIDRGTWEVTVFTTDGASEPQSISVGNDDVRLECVIKPTKSGGNPAKSGGTATPLPNK